MHISGSSWQTHFVVFSAVASHPVFTVPLVTFMAHVLSVFAISLRHLEGSEGDLGTDMKGPLYFELLTWT